MRFGSLALVWLLLSMTAFGQAELIAQFPLQDSANDAMGNLQISSQSGITFTGDGPTRTLTQSAHFDGTSSIIEIASSPKLELATEPFSIAAWVNAPSGTGDVPGDIISQYDPQARTGFHLGLYSHGGVTNAQSNQRQLHFGIDQAVEESGFTDHGQLGNAVYIFSLCVHQGKLYASTCHAGATEAGRVFRFDGGDHWTDFGAPDNANAVSAMTVFKGELYVASSKYRLAGSSLAESENVNFGGKVFRLDSDDQWTYCGTLSAKTEAVASLIEYRGDLYAASLYKPAGFFRYEGGVQWTACETPGGKRVEATTAFNGSIYATCYDEGAVFRFDGKSWYDAGRIPNATQTYGFAVHSGSLFVSEWPQAHVYRYLGDGDWVDTGKLGDELEAMPLMVYNGKMYGGTLPLAEIYRYDSDQVWSKIGRIDHTPDVKYRRAWSMAVYQGRLFVGALPSGRVLSIEMGRNATFDQPLATGWHHVAAVRDSDRLRLYVDGQQVSESAVFTAERFNLSTGQPVRIGFGAQDHFHGNLADVRIYRGALSSDDVKRLSDLVFLDPKTKTTEK